MKFDIILNASFLILFCLVHSLLAREWAKNALARVIGARFMRLFYVLLALLTLSLVLHYWRPIPGVLWETKGTFNLGLRILSYLCLFGGIYSIYVINYLEFFGIDSLLPGRQNQPVKSPVLFTGGPYAYCRHPMYLFFGLSAFLNPTMTYGDLQFLFIIFIYIVIAIPFEERSLRNELGEDYDLYRQNVPVIIPRPRPWKFIESSHTMKKDH